MVCLTSTKIICGQHSLHFRQGSLTVERNIKMLLDSTDMDRRIFIFLAFYSNFLLIRLASQQ